MKDTVDKITQLLANEVATKTGLLTGLGGQILTCAEMFLENRFPKDRVSQLVQILENKLTCEDFVFTHCDGLAGIGWLYEYLSQREIVDYDTNTLLEDFDIYLEKALNIFMQQSNYDFLHGGVGIVLYFVKRVEKKKELVQVLNQFLDDLVKISIQQDSGTIKWSSFLSKEAGWGYNISLAHGMSSIVAILSKLYEIKRIDKEKTEKLLRGAVQYILAQWIDKDKYGSYFTNFALESTTEISKSRLGWCYGDLGIATSLYQAGTVLKEQIWCDKALEVFLFTALQRKSLVDNFVQDACLCHGAAGIGHIFYRMWWNTRLPEFKEAADYWFEQTLKMAVFEDGLAGFKTFEAPDGKPQWVNRYSLLEGVAGIGLAMLAYHYEIEPAWDECLLLS